MNRPPAKAKMEIGPRPKPTVHGPVPEQRQQANRRASPVAMPALSNAAVAAAAVTAAMPPAKSWSGVGNAAIVAALKPASRSVSTVQAIAKEIVPPSATAAAGAVQPSAMSRGTPAARATMPAVAAGAAGRGRVVRHAAAPADRAGRGKVPEHKKATAAPAVSPRDAIGPAIAAVHHRAVHARAHRPADVPVASAQAAAIMPKTEQTRTAATQTVANLHAATDQTKPVARDEFKRKLKEAIESATPKPTTESQAEKVMKTGAAEASAHMRGQLTSERDAAAGPLKSESDAKPVDPSLQPAPPQTSLQPEPVGAPPAPISPALVAPAPLPPERLDYSSDREPTDRAMAENNVTKAQLEKGNEPSFGQTLQARASAEEYEASAQARYRQTEAKVQDHAKDVARAELANGLGAMHGSRLAHVGQVVGSQIGTTAKNARERQRITETINGIRDKTRADVADILTFMETEASDVFEAGLKLAEQAYQDTFEEAKGGTWTWLTTWGDDWEELIKESLDKAREKYLQQVNIAIDQVVAVVDGKLAAAKARVAEGRTQVNDFCKGLDVSVQQFADEAIRAVNTDFDAMGEEIDQRRDTLVNKLAQQYKSSYERMSAMEEKLREENKSLWQRIYDATVGLIKKILAFKNMLLSILAKAAGVVVGIISDPIGFLGNLVSGVMQGLKNFMSNIGEHLKKGLMEWLFGALAGAGLRLQDTFDLEGIVGIVLQVLRLTYANFRARAVAIMGEPIVATLEKAAEIFKVIATEGIFGLWRFIKEKVDDLKSMVLDAIFDFIKERVIIAGVTWIIGLLNPASAFFKACKAIYDIVMFFISRGSQVVDLVNAIIDSVAAIAKGSLGVAATMVENALAKAVPVAIGFLAGLLGLGDISGTVRSTIEKAQTPVNKAIDWAINQAVKLVRAAGKAIGGLSRGKKEDKKDEDEEKEQGPVKTAKVNAGLVAIDREEETLLENGKLTRRNANSVAKNVRKAHPVFTSLTAIDAGTHWDYDYTASPGKKYVGKHQKKEEDDPKKLSDEELAEQISKYEKGTEKGDKLRYQRYLRDKKAANESPLPYDKWFGSSRGGRSGGPEHQEIQDKLVDKGFKKEVAFGERFADAASDKEIHQIGSTNERGDPIARERDAILDIIKSPKYKANPRPIYFHDKNTSKKIPVVDSTGKIILKAWGDR